MKLVESIIFHQLDDVVESELTLQLMLVIQSDGHLYSYQENRQLMKKVHEFWILLNYKTKNLQATSILESLSLHLSTKTIKTPLLKVRLIKLVSTLLFILYQKSKKKSKMIRLFILSWLCLCLALQEETLTIKQTFELHLNQNQSKTYSINVPKRETDNQDLYIHSMPKYSDPLETPYLTISSDKQFIQECFSAANQFAGVCHIGSKELIQNRVFKLEIKCATACDIIVHIYQSQNAVLELGSNLKLNAFAQTGLTEIIQVTIPKNVTFTGLAVMAMILNLEESIQLGDEGVDLLINYGNNISVANPQQNQYKLRGQSLNGGGKGAFIYSYQINTGGTIKCLLKIRKNVSVRFSVISMNQNQLNIDLGKSYFDYVNKQTPKIYSMNTTSYSLANSSKTLEIVFDIYSGNPDFLISFTKDFTKTIQYNKKISAVSILLSPQIRTKLNFKDMIYIKVTSQVSSEYYFYSNFIRGDVTFVEPYFMYLDQVSKDKVQNYIMTETYKYPEGSKDTLRNYSFKVEIIEGQGVFYFKRCKSYQRKALDNPSFKQCLVHNASYFKQKAFLDEEVQNKHISTGNLLTISMNYDISQCTKVSNHSGFISVKCSFLILAVGVSGQPFQFSFLPQRIFFVNYLRQNKVHKQYIPKDNYAHYVFSLPQIQTVSEINIFVTTFSGDSALIVSPVDRYPTLESKGKKMMESGAKNNIILKKDQLALEFYISVYAYQFTEINIGVIVHRTTSNASVHEFPLLQGNVQTYIINQTQPNADFKFNSKNSSEIAVLLNELSGHIDMSIVDSQGNGVTCTDHQQNRLICKFVPKKNTGYTVKVTGDTKQQNKFSITYRTEKRQCFNSKLNQPIFVTLQPLETYCYNFNVNRQISIIFASSFTHVQIFDAQILTTLNLNTNQFAFIDSPHKQITFQQMKRYCPVGKSKEGFVQTCQLTLIFENKVDSTNFFSFVMEQIDAEIALFDGINEKIKGKSIQIGTSKNFYYSVVSQTNIQIFFSTRSLRSHYFFAAKFVLKQVFLSRNNENNNIYLPYVPKSDRPAANFSKSQNYFSAILGQTGLQRLVIDSQQIKKYCQGLNCYLIISIYPQFYNDYVGLDVDEYQIEVSQQETYLALGNSKIGMLNKGQYYTYLIDSEDAIVQFQQMYSNGVSSICVDFDAALADGTIVKGNQYSTSLQVSKKQKIEKIFVKGVKNQCSFQIKYLSNKNPYQNVQISHPYDISVSSGQAMRFVYYHQNPKTFRIIQMASAGNSQIHVMPISQSKFTLSSLDSLSYTAFPVFKSYDGEYLIQSINPFFCSSCYYYVVITAKTKFVGQIIFLRVYDPIPLTSKHIFKHQLSPLINKKMQSFIYYSLTTFNITFNILSGKMEIKIKDPQGQIVAAQQISQKTTFIIKSLEYKKEQKVEYYSQKAKFLITISANQQTEYYIQINRNLLSTRIFEGYPSTVLIQSVMSQTIQFINTQALDKPLYVMVDILDKQKEDISVNFTVAAEDSEGRLITSQEILKNVTRSDNTFRINMKNIQGRYFLSVRTNVSVNATLLLVKNSLTYISPKRNYLFEGQGVYQVYSNNRKVLVEIFNCEGDVTLMGSRYEREMNADYISHSPLQITRPNFGNYGGHYVFSIEADYPSYFIRVSNKFPSYPLEYVINYYYYESVNPYDLVDAPKYDITSQFKEDGLHLSVMPPIVIDSSVHIVKTKIKNITYIAYASPSKKDLNRYSRCSIDGDVIKKEEKSPNFTLNNLFLSRLLIQSDINKLYVTVEASIQIQETVTDQSTASNFPTTLTIFYDTIQITKETRTIVQQSRSDKEYWFTDNVMVFLFWMTLLTALSIAIPYYLVRICIKRFIKRQQNLTEQVEMNCQERSKPTQQRMDTGMDSAGSGIIGSATNIPINSGQTTVKQEL